MGRYVLSVVFVLMIVATAVADLGFMHASNEVWPPHARLHAVWNVLHVLGTHSVALGLLWVGARAGSIQRVRAAALVSLAFVASFFGAALLAPLFGASVHPDLPLHERPPTLLGMDGNTLGFVLIVPVVVWAWWTCERDAVRKE